VVGSYLRTRIALKGDAGATAIEYAIMVALIALVIFATVGLLGIAVDGSFADFLNEMPG